MTSIIGPDMWIDMYVRNRLQADEDWLERGDASCTYWQARLAQTTSAQVVSEFGDVKWRVRTVIVADVGDPALAKELCLALNMWAAGWSFAYDEADRTVNAIAAIYAPIAPFPTEPMNRLTEVARLSAWMSDVIAERLANAVGGRPAFTHPGRHAGVRTIFDDSYYYLQALRGRPEWLLDYTDAQFPTLAKIGPELASRLGVNPDWLSVDKSECIVVKLDDAASFLVSAYFRRHPVFGQCWTAYFSMPEVIGDYAVNAAHALAWKMFSDHESTLLGAWTYVDRALAFEQWSTTSELRQGENSASFVGHESRELTDRVLSVMDAVNVTQELDPDEFRVEGGLTEEERNAQGTSLIKSAIDELTPPLLTDDMPSDAPHADRGLLWLERRAVLAIAAWFNPMGPTVATLEVCGRGSDDDDHLVYFMRHPILPDYRVIGPIESSADFEAALREGFRLLFDEGGSLPTVIDLRGPEDVMPQVAPLLYDRVLEVSQAKGVDLAAHAAKIASCMGRPWDLAPGARPADLNPKYSQEDWKLRGLEASPLPLKSASPDPGFTAWWSEVARPENVVAHFCELPDAWDASLNLLIESGELKQFDAGPFILTYQPSPTVLPWMNNAQADDA